MVRPAGRLAWSHWLLGLGIAAPLAANVAHGMGHGLAGGAMAAWPAAALAGSYEVLMMIIRSAQTPANSASGTGLTVRHWTLILCRRMPRGCLSTISRRAVSRRCARSATNFIWASPGRSGCAHLAILTIR
jgi:hypothetical protein